jgi:hypothetical protein
MDELMNDNLTAAHALRRIPHGYAQDGYFMPVHVLSPEEADVEIDEEGTVLAELEPGQASVHDGKLLHASGPNRSDERRIGLTINYIAPHVRQVVTREDFATLVRGEDRYGHFRHVPPPSSDLSDEAMAWHARILDAQNDAMYHGAWNDPTSPVSA